MKQADVCVIGSGPAGSMAAYELARRGRSVIVLERGPYIAADELALGDRPLAPERWESMAELAAPRGPRGPVQTTMPTQVGGGGETYGAVSLRFHPDDFRMRSARGAVPGAAVADWPFGHAELEPCYAEVEQLLGVGPLDLGCEATRRFDEAIGKRGWHARPAPLAIRPSCVRCGYCAGFACRVGAKSSPTATTLREAVATGRCEIVARAFAHRLVMAGDAAAAVDYSDHLGGRGRIEAATFVLACGAIFTPRLLLLTRSNRFPEGLGNHGDRVGRTFCSHVTPMVTARFDAAMHPASTAYVARNVDDFYFAEPPLWKGGVFQLQLSGPAQLTIYYCGDALPQLANRVVLSSLLDRFGYPLPRVEHAYHPLDLASGRAGVALSGQILTEMGGREPRQNAWVEQWGGGFHFSGTCRAGDDEATCVVDRTGRVHGSANVYVCDASVFPTSGGANPALTVQASALRIARGLAA